MYLWTPNGGERLLLLLQSIDLQWMRKGRISKNWFYGTRKSLRPFLAISDIYFNFYHFFSKTEIIYSARYWLKSLQFGQYTQFSGRLDTYAWGWPSVKIHSWPNLGEEVLRGQNRQNYSCLSQSIENLNSYNILKNQLPGSIKKEDMGFFLFFWPW